MLNLSCLQDYLRLYKRYFPFIFYNRESYKWESVQRFQNVYDEYAVDFVEMLRNALDKSRNLLDSGRSRDKQALLDTISSSGENAKEAFLALLNGVSGTSIELTNRVKTFTRDFNAETKRVLSPSDQRNQDTHCASVYLSHKYPDLMYLYRHKDINGFFEEIEGTTPFISGDANNYQKYHNICNELNCFIKGAIAADAEFRAIVQSAVESSDKFYSDPEYHILTQDFIYFVAHHKDIYKGNRPAENGPQSWIVPCNIKQYDVDGIFKDYGYTYWRQLQQNNAGIQPQFKPGDTAYIYIAGQGIRYKCRVTESFIPFNDEVSFDLPYWKKGADKSYSNRQLFAKFELLDSNLSDCLTYDEICALGVTSVRRSITISADLAEKIEAKFNQTEPAPKSVQYCPIRCKELSTEKAHIFIPKAKEISGQKTAYKPDYDKVQKEKSELGKSGEEWVIGYEQQKLKDAGRFDLIEKVKWVSEHDDSLGYDILSYDITGSEIFIEVKTTRGSVRTDFFVSTNEKNCSDQNQEKYRLYRLYNYIPEHNSTNLLILKGSLSPLCERATTFAVSIVDSME